MNTVTYNWRSIINNKKKKKKRRREKCLRNETYRSVGWERGKAPLVRRGGKASPMWRKSKCRWCKERWSIVGGRKSITIAKKAKRRWWFGDLYRHRFEFVWVIGDGSSQASMLLCRAWYFFFFLDQKLIRRVVKASVLIGIEIGLVWEYL